MIGLECDDPELKRCLRTLEKQVTAGGGWLSDVVSIVAEGGGIRVETELGPANHDLLLSVPEELLLPVELVEWRLAGDDLCIGAFVPGVSRARRELFETVVEIYNLTHKIATHRRRSPCFALADDAETLEYVLAGRDRAPERDEEADQAVIRDFFHSRVFDFDYGKEVEGRRDVLMPFIDFLNHHPLAAGYQTASAVHPGQPVIASVNSKPDSESRECFVRYGIFDAYDLWTAYAFVGKSCAFVRSIPLTIELAGLGKLAVHAVPGAQIKKQLPAPVADLHFFMPQAAKRESGTVALSHLMIPGPRAPHALRRVLARFIGAFEPGMEQGALAEFVREAERRVLAENVAYYEGLRERVRERRASGAADEIYTMAEELAEVQLARLGGYAFME